MTSLEFKINLGQRDGDKRALLNPVYRFCYFTFLLLVTVTFTKPILIIACTLLFIIIALTQGTSIKTILLLLASAIPLFLMLLIFQSIMPFNNANTVLLFHFYFLKLSQEQLTQIIFFMLRSMSAIFFFTAFLASFSISALVYALEKILHPLSLLRFPSYRLVMSFALIFRFIPILASELENIVRAQATRGAGFGADDLNIIKRIRAYIPLFVPIVIRTLERAHSLAYALDVRGFTGEQHTRYKEYPTTKRDHLSLIVAIPGLMAYVYFLVF